ncbi:MAG: hypothetical protein AB7P49_00880 [Bdellovibrionales bacterium]
MPPRDVDPPVYQAEICQTPSSTKKAQDTLVAHRLQVEPRINTDLLPQIRVGPLHQDRKLSPGHLTRREEVAAGVLGLGPSRTARMELLLLHLAPRHRVVMLAQDRGPRLHQPLRDQVVSQARALKLHPRADRLMGLEQSQIQVTLRTALNPEDPPGAVPKVECPRSVPARNR